MRVIGIDPGYDRLGIAIIEKNKGEKEKLLHSTCVTTKTSDAFADRLKEIGDAFEKEVKQWQPKILSIENLFISKNQKTANRVSETRGVIIYIATNYGLKVYEYTPMEIKITISGYGKATKNQVTSMVKKLVSIPDKKALDDEYDAIAIGLTYLARERF